MDYSRVAKNILEEIRYLEKLIEEHKEVLQEYPDDFAIQLSIQQFEARLEKLREDYRKYSSLAKKHILDLVLEAHQDNIEVDKVISSLGTFYEVLNTIYHEITNKNEKIKLYFDAIYKGSFGMLLTTPFDDKFIASDYEITFKIFFEIMNLIIQEKDKNKIHNSLQEILRGDKEVIKKLKKFIKTFINVKEPLRIEWENPIKQKKYKIKISLEELELIDGILEKELSPEILDIEASGIIKMIDLLSNKIKLEIDGITKEKYEFLKRRKILKISFPDYLADKIKEKIDLPVNLKIRATLIHNDITEEEEKETFELINILR